VWRSDFRIQSQCVWTAGRDIGHALKVHGPGNVVRARLEHVLRPVPGLIRQAALQHFARSLRASTWRASRLLKNGKSRSSGIDIHLVA
jgi:hypothetical protein